MVTWSNGNLTVNTSGYSTAKATVSKSSGKWFWEITIVSGTSFIVGIANESVPLTGSTFNNVGARWYGSVGETFSPRVLYGTAYDVNDVIGVLLNFDDGTLTYYKNGVNQGVAFTDINGLGEVFPSVSRISSSGSQVVLANFGASEFSFLPKDLPSGTMSYNGNKVLKALSETLILHEGSYKKWIQKMYGQSETTTAVPIMTSNNLPSGFAESSSYYSNDTRYLPFRAFNGTTGDANNAWISSTASNEWISYEFPSPVVINKYAIAPNSTLNKSEPKSFRFEGYDGAKWVVLDSREDVTVWTANVYNTFETYNNNAYKKYRLFVLSNNGFAMYVSMSDIKLFKQTTPSILTSLWQTVSTTLPTVTEFTEQGMDSLSPLLDRNVLQLEPQDMTVKIGILPVESTAKVFSKKFSLSKYIDIKKIEVK